MLNVYCLHYFWYNAIQIIIPNVLQNIFQTANGVSSKVMDDYCWIHSTFHVRSEFQGNVGCILDTVLAGHNSIAMAAAETPDTAFYQWVPFTLVFQVRYSKI